MGILAYIVLLIFGILYLGPLLMLVSTALKSLPGVFQECHRAAGGAQPDNFVTAWEQANFARLLVNSAISHGRGDDALRHHGHLRGLP